MAKRRVGRPTRPPRSGERVTLGLRVTADLKRKLEKDAGKSGRSLSQEAEIRLEQSYDREWIAKLVQAMVMEAWSKRDKEPER
jgi:hypothetical protein